MWIDKNTYMEKMKDTRWMPGLEAIQGAFAKVYGNVGEYVPAKDVANMRSNLEGFDVYQSSHGYTHIVTRGLSQIHPHKDARHNRFSGWGLELTIKWLNDDSIKTSESAFRLLDRLADCIDVRKEGFIWMFSPIIKIGQLSEDSDEMVLVPDTEIPTIDTIHGEVNFRQVVNISKEDAKHVGQSPARVESVLARMREENPNLPFHRNRPPTYLTG